MADATGTVDAKTAEAKTVEAGRVEAGTDTEALIETAVDAVAGEDNQEPKVETTVRGVRKIPRGAHLAYIAIAGLAFTVLVVVFTFLPRETYSELEKRDLAEFPDASEYTSEPGKLTAAISQWFSDTEPHRDAFMTLSMSIRDAMRVSFGGDEAVTFRPAAPAVEEAGEDTADNPLTEDIDNPLANENAKVANAGIVVVGSGSNVRALMAYGGGEKSGKPYIELLAEYARRFPGKNVYALISPTATEFYLPEKAKKCSNPQRPTIEYVRQNLPAGVKFVDAYSALARHVDEDIYLRTDHHWAPLGGYYAAEQLARVAGVPFKDLGSYDRNVIHGFVGSMYGYSKDIAVKNAPEDFVYYTPRGVEYQTTYITYRTNNNYQVVSQSAPTQGTYFYKFKDGSGNAYLTFMGSDQKLTKVKTSTPGNRKLLIVKDSYGNTIPGYLFYSFAEIHVVDFRYFKNNMVDYVNTNGITDICIAFNIFNICSSSTAQKVRNFLTQRTGDFSAESVQKADNATKSDESKATDRATGSHTETSAHTETATPASEPEPAPEPTPTPEPESEN